MYAAAVSPHVTHRPAVVRSAAITRPDGTLASGSAVSARAVLGPRTFVDARDGFALVATGEAQYVAATTDGGRSWHTDSPALHLDAAQAPLVVTALGAASRRVVFAYGSGNVVDVTSDGGRHWRRAIWPDGVPAAVVPTLQGALVAFVQPFPRGPAQQYVSRDGGRSWHYTTMPSG